MYQEKLTLLLVSLCCPPCSVIAVIAATLFPLWPAEMRVGVYYLSVGAGCFVASILLLAVGECRQAGSRRPQAQPSSSRARSWAVLLPRTMFGRSRADPDTGQRVSQLCHGKRDAMGRERAQARVTCWCSLCSADSFSAAV